MKTPVSVYQQFCRKSFMFLFLLPAFIMCCSFVNAQERTRLQDNPQIRQAQRPQESILRSGQSIPLHQLQYQGSPQDTALHQAAIQPAAVPVTQVSPASRYVKPNLRDNSHVIQDTMASVPIKVLEGDQVVEVIRPVSGFRLAEGQNLAMIQSRPVMEQVESSGVLEVADQQMKLEGVALPEIYMARIVRPSPGSGTTGPSNDAAILRVLVDTLPVLRYDRESQHYSGEFLVLLLEDSRQVLSSDKLAEAVPLQFTSSLADFEPGMLFIGHTNVPATRIRITDKSPENPVPVKIITRFNPFGYVTHLAKQALLRFDTQPGKIQGMGIQAVPVTISLQNYLNHDSVRVHFVASQGIVDPDTLYLTRHRAGKVLLKSQGTGKTVLTANAPGFLSETLNLEFAMPWSFVLLTLVGGIIGALLKHLMKPEKGKLLPGIAKGFLAGLVVGLLYYLTGFDVLNLNLGREYYEFAVLLLAILGALFWEQVYDKLAKLVTG